MPNNKAKSKDKPIEKVATPSIPKETKKLEIRNVPLSATVWVVSNCVGELLYISKKTGYEVTWNEFNSKQPMSLEEILVMRNTQKKFMQENWIKISGFIDEIYSQFSVEEILTFLQIREYYTNTLCPDDINDVFNMSPEDIKEKVPNMSSGVKNAITIRANDLIKNGQLDSFKRISALETALNCELSRP